MFLFSVQIVGPLPSKTEYSSVSLNLGTKDDIPAGCLPLCRYKNILPPPKTRVSLEPLPGVKSEALVQSRFINASYIRGYDGQVKYIATQGPKKETVDAFWRLVWEHNSGLVLMLTGESPREILAEGHLRHWFH